MDRSLKDFRQFIGILIFLIADYSFRLLVLISTVRKTIFFAVYCFFEMKSETMILMTLSDSKNTQWYDTSK